MHEYNFQPKTIHPGDLFTSANCQMECGSAVVVWVSKVDALLEVAVQGGHVAVEGREQQDQTLLVLGENGGSIF